MLLQQIINGLALGAVYALIALGYTMVYGILEMINFAHGEIYMIGSYLGIILLGLFISLLGPSATVLHLPLILVVVTLGAAVICAGYGVTMERIAYRPLRSAHRLAPLISALGVSIFLQNYVMLTQGSADRVAPHLFEGESYAIGSVMITPIQIAIMITSTILMAGLHLFIQKTRMGKAMRAVAQDQTMASLCGIPINRVISVTFIMSAALAAVAGVMVSLYYGVTHFFIGYVAGIKAFTAAVLGGIGHLPGAMVGGLLLGLLESLGAAYISSEFKDGFAFLVLILILIFRPTGLFGERVAAR